MEPPRRSLKIVFNETGEDPLVLEALWLVPSTREHPELTKVGKAKPRLRALSILLMLAKYRDSHPPKDRNTQFWFEAPFATNTWITTISNDFKGVLKWTKDRFHLPSSEDFFLTASFGAMHSGGKALPTVEFLNERLPPNGLELQVSNPRKLGSKPRPLEGQELLTLALRFESKYWHKKNSAVKALYPTAFDENDIAIASPGDGLLDADTADDRNYLAFASMISAPKTIGDLAEWKKHHNFLFKMLMEKELDNYRRDCMGFFSYVGDSLSSVMTPFLWNKREWSRPQLKILLINCSAIGIMCFMCAEVRNKLSESLNKKLKMSPIWERIGFKFGVPNAIYHVFMRLADPEKYAETSVTMAGLEFIAKGMDPRLILSSPLLLPELELLNAELAKGIGNSSIAESAGCLFAHQILTIDFLEKVCMPFNAPSTIQAAGVANLWETILILKEEAFNNRDMLLGLCNTGEEFLQAAQAARRTIKNQVAAYQGLYKKLVSLDA
jgi:hypothetical protein